MNLPGNYYNCTNMNKEQQQQQQQQQQLQQQEHPCLFVFSQKMQSLIDRGKSWVSEICLFVISRLYILNNLIRC